MINLKIIGNRLKANRVSRFLTQKELADRLGVTQNAVSQYESGARLPRREIRDRYCELYDIDESCLFSSEPDRIAQPPRLLKRILRLFRCHLPEREEK